MIHLARFRKSPRMFHPRCPMKSCQRGLHHGPSSHAFQDCSFNVTCKYRLHKEQTCSFYVAKQFVLNCPSVSGLPGLLVGRELKKQSGLLNACDSYTISCPSKQNKTKKHAKTKKTHKTAKVKIKPKTNFLEIKFIIKADIIIQELLQYPSHRDEYFTFII